MLYFSLFNVLAFFAFLGPAAASWTSTRYKLMSMTGFTVGAAQLIIWLNEPAVSDRNSLFSVDGSLAHLLRTHPADIAHRLFARLDRYSTRYYKSISTILEEPAPPFIDMYYDQFMTSLAVISRQPFFDEYYDKFMTSLTIVTQPQSFCFPEDRPPLLIAAVAFWEAPASDKQLVDQSLSAEFCQDELTYIMVSSMTCPVEYGSVNSAQEISGAHFGLMAFKFFEDGLSRAAVASAEYKDMSINIAKGFIGALLDSTPVDFLKDVASSNGTSATPLLELASLIEYGYPISSLASWDDAASYAHALRLAVVEVGMNKKVAFDDALVMLINKSHKFLVDNANGPITAAAFGILVVLVALYLSRVDSESSSPNLSAFQLMLEEELVTYTEAEQEEPTTIAMAPSENSELTLVATLDDSGSLGSELSSTIPDDLGSCPPLSLPTEDTTPPDKTAVVLTHSQKRNRKRRAKAKEMFAQLAKHAPQETQAEAPDPSDVSSGASVPTAAVKKTARRRWYRSPRV